MKDNKVLATVNDKPITQQDVDALLQSLGPQRAMQFYSEEGQKRLLDELIRQELIYSDAVDNGVESEEGFKKELAQMKANLLKQYAINKLVNSVKVTEEEVINYYNENKALFKKPESVRASHILVDDEGKAGEILEEINKGLTFEDAAKKYSKCPSGSKGGDLGEFTRGKMVPEFETVAFDMQKDEISQPVKTQFGYHLIKVVDKKEAGISTLDEIKDQLYQQVLAMKQNDIYMRKCDELKKTYEVKVNG
ncbi:MAG: peptidyl-prolyl cis-trans isomerase [Clostridiales bacterium]|jgi:peptidyl-prolyl cis-trans isomerase C|nr:peptidyl-prolyl cis-trans isomerase [Clostridiales bacterium]MDK2932881.1 peptidyl-prolyl cis-trans isomerase [Clostridiales bacterium]